jgi:hypothetical protein
MQSSNKPSQHSMYCCTSFFRDDIRDPLLVNERVLYFTEWIYANKTDRRIRRDRIYFNDWAADRSGRDSIRNGADLEQALVLIPK